MGSQKSDNDKSHSSQPSIYSLESKRRLVLPKIPQVLGREIDMSTAKISHRINAVMHSCFDRYINIHGNKTLLFPGAELQVIYNCQNISSTQAEEEKLASWVIEVITTELKAMDYHVSVRAVLFPTYTQFSISLYRHELYTAVSIKLYGDEL